MRKNLVYIGLDIHKNFSNVTVLSANGELIAQKKLRTFSDEYYEFFAELSNKAELRIAFEACSMLRKVSSELERYGKVKVAHPAKVRLIAETKLKSDKTDSLALARLLRLNELPEAWVCRDGDIVELRALTRERIRLKQDITRYKSQIRHLLLANGVVMEGRIFTKKKREELANLGITEIRRRLELIERLEKEIVYVNDGIADLSWCFRYELDILKSIPGIGFYIASLLIAEMGDVSRFRKFKKLASYAGLVPITYQSGPKQWHGRITKQGNKYIRWALVEAANIAIKMDANLKSFYLRIARKKGHKKAIVAVAKKGVSLKIIYELKSLSI